MKNSNSKFNNFKFSVKSNKEIKSILSKYPSNRKESGVLPILDLAQRDCGGWLPMEVIEKVAEVIGMPQIRVLEIASFYSMFNLKPVGRNTISVCTNVSCMLRNSDDIVSHIEKRLKIKIGESTKDNKFYLKDEMECLAACNGAPMMQVNHINYENLTFEKVDKILDEIAND